MHAHYCSAYLVWLDARHDLVVRAQQPVLLPDACGQGVWGVASKCGVGAL